MAKSKGRLLAELLGSDGKVKESKSALEISGGKIKIDEVPTIPNSKLANSGITIAGENTALGGSVSLNTGHITEHTNFKYYTDARARASISATGSLSYNATTGVMSFTMPAQNTGSITEGSNLYFTDARARAAISVSGNALSYNSSTGVITSNFEESPTFTGTITTRNITMDIPDGGQAPAMSATLMIKGYEGRGAGIKIRDSVNSASSANNREWFIGSGYAQSGFNIGYASDGSQSSYTAQNKFSISTAGHASFAGNITATGNLSAPIYYDSDNTSRYFNGNGTSVFGHITTSNINASGTHTFTANDVDFIVQDTTDTITNYIWRHHGNSALYLGSQDAIVNIRSPLQIQGTQVFDSSRNMSNVGTISSGAVTSSGKIKTTGGELEFTSANHQLTTSNANNIQARIGAAGAAGLHMEDSGSNFRFQIYGDGTNYGFLNSEWGSWNLKKVTSGALYFNNNNSYYIQPESTSYFNTMQAAIYKIGTTTVIDSSRNFIANSRLTFDYNDHYLEPGTGNLTLKNASNAALVTLGQESQFNGTIRVNSHVSGITDINIGTAISGHNTSSPARITAGSAGNLYIDSTSGQHIYLGWYNGPSADIISEMNARFASYKDRNDTAYHMNPAGASLIRNLVIKGTTSDSSTDALHIKNSGGTTQSYFRNDGTVVIGGSQYLYVTAGGGAYFSNSIKARGGINNDQGDLTLSDTVQVAGPLIIQGSGSEERYLAFTLDGKSSAFSGSNNAYIFNGQGSTGDYLAGALYFQSRSNSVSREIGFITGTTPAKRLVINNSGITVTGTITGDITGSLSGTATQASNLNNHNTGNLSEGSNLYYTDSRVGTYLSNNGYATQSTIVAAITDSAPTTLDTLNELAAALGDDASFSTTVTNSIATKAPIANPSLTGNTSIAGNLVMSNTTSEIRLGSYLKLHGATGSNTATLSVNATYGGAQTDSWTPVYSGDVNAGMWLLRQSSGGSGTMQVYQKKHGTTSSSTGRGTFTKTAEFNIDGYFYGRNLRSERYYSSDNTAYYTDPSETSVVNKFMVNGGGNNSGKADFAVGTGGNPQVSWNGSQVQIGGTDMNWNGKINYGSNIFSMAAWDAQIDFFIQGGTTSRNIVFKPSNAGTATERLTIYGDTGIVQAGGSIRSTSEMRAPHYYDIDNTVYYTNPATTSVMNTIQLGTNSSPTLSDVSEYLNVQTSYGYFRVGPGNGSYNHMMTDTPQFYFNKKIVIDEGIVRSYDEDLQLDRAGSTTARIRITSGTTHSDQPLTVAGNVQHTGLTMTSGSDVDQLYTVTVSAQLTTSWQDTGINGGDLSTGTYIVQIYADSDVPRYHYQEFYSGVMSWFSGGTNSNEVDEITLHRAGHAPNDGNIFLRTLRHPSGGDNLMLQLRATHNSTSASNYIFKFRRMI